MQLVLEPARLQREVDVRVTARRDDLEGIEHGLLLAGLEAEMGGNRARERERRAEVRVERRVEVAVRVVRQRDGQAELVTLGDLGRQVRLERQRHLRLQDGLAAADHAACRHALGGRAEARDRVVGDERDVGVAVLVRLDARVPVDRLAEVGARPVVRLGVLRHREDADGRPADPLLLIEDVIAVAVERLALGGEPVLAARAGRLRHLARLVLHRLLLLAAGFLLPLDPVALRGDDRARGRGGLLHRRAGASGRRGWRRGHRWRGHLRRGRVLHRHRRAGRVGQLGGRRREHLLPLEVPVATGREERVHRGRGLGLVREVEVRLLDGLRAGGGRAELGLEEEVRADLRGLVVREREHGVVGDRDAEVRLHGLARGVRRVDVELDLVAWRVGLLVGRQLDVHVLAAAVIDEALGERLALAR